MTTKNLASLAGRRILISTTPFDGHVNPLTGIAVFLKELGADVRWYSSATYREKIEKFGIPFYEFKHAPKADSSNIPEHFYDREKIVDAGEKANYDMEHFFAKLAPGAFADIQEVHSKFRFDLMISDSTFTAIPLVKHRLRVPVIAIGITPLAEESVDLGPFGPGFLPPANEGQLEEYQKIRQHFFNHVFRSSTEAYSGILTANQIKHDPSIIFDMVIRQADLYLQIGSPSFEYKRSDLGANVRFIGALLPFSPRSKERWTDDRLLNYPKVVLVTQGTVEYDTSKIIEPTLHAFRGTDVLVVATTGGSKTEELKGRFPDRNFIIEDFIPFEDIMPNADVYVTNGGYGGVLLSIKNGLPMVTAGIHEGKAETCARIGYFGYGVNLKTENPTPESIREGVNKVFNDTSYEINVRSLCLEMKAYNSNERVAGHIVELLEKAPARRELV